MGARKLSLHDVVGPQTYAVWVDMLLSLVQNGRTHRLAPLIAGMLQHAAVIADAKVDEHQVEGTAADTLRKAEEVDDPEEVNALLLGMIDRLFTDAGVSYRRTSARGEGYSIADEILYEYFHWYNMPWEA